MTVQDEKEMFGIDKAGMDESIAINAEFCGHKMLIMSELSDLQEEIACDYTSKEQQRQKINRIKYWLQKI